jgi:probable addiction module antidote protein
MVKSVAYDAWLRERLRDPKEALAYLNEALRDEDPRVFLLAMRDVAQAAPGIGKLAEQSGLNRESLYRLLSRQGNPSLETLSALLQSLRLRMWLGPAEERKPRTKERAWSVLGPVGAGPRWGAGLAVRQGWKAAKPRGANQWVEAA